MNFESELKKGKLFIPECNQCNKIIWPPSEFCNQCLKEVSWRTSSYEGKVVEFSKQNNIYFCMVEIENSIKIIGKISSGIPNVGQHVKIEKCGIRDGSYYFELLLL